MRYTEQERAFVEAGIALEKSAEEIAAELPNRTAISVYNFARTHYDVRLATVPRKEKVKTVNPPPTQGYQIPPARHLGVTVREGDVDEWQGWLDDIFNRTGLHLLRDQWAYALQAGAEKARGDG